MFTGYKLSEATRQILMDLFPPKYPDVIGHHVTEQFGVKKTDLAPEMPVSARIVGYVDDGQKVEGFLVEINGSVNRPSGGLYHLTWSIDRSKGAKPVDTNAVLKNAKAIESIDLSITPKNFHNA